MRFRPEGTRAVWIATILSVAGAADATPSASPVEPTIVRAIPAASRVRLPAATFAMGSTVRDVETAEALCAREPYRRLCVAPAFRLLRTAETPAHPVTLDAFAIDRFEVTVAAYAQCVRAGFCARPGFLPGDARYDREHFPVTWVRATDAETYCDFVGGRLPTEAEWEYAARGASGRTFPWGQVLNPMRANHGSFGPDETDERDGYEGLSPVGSFADGATPEGIDDLAGNVAEWVLDHLAVDEQGNGIGYSPAPQRNPLVRAGLSRITRGGSYMQGTHALRGAARGITAAERAPDVGFRCVYP